MRFDLNHERGKCYKKTSRGNSFPNEKRARKALRDVRNSNPGLKHLVAYQCVICNKFHLGKQQEGEVLKPDKQILRYYGSKQRIAPWLNNFFAIDHYCFADTYGGGASELFQKPPSRLEIYNDLDLTVTTFFRVLRDRTHELIRAIELTPYSRDELEQACLRLKFVDEWYPRPWTLEQELEISRLLYIKSRQGRSGNTSPWNASWRCENRKTRDKHQVEEWNETDHLYAGAARLKKVQIENKPALEFIRKYDDRDTLFYLDPPYVHDTRYTNWTSIYRFEMSDEDHKDLAELLYGIRGMAIISGYPGNLYNELFTQKGWSIHTIQTRDVQNQYKTEAVWLNPAAQKRQKQLSMF
jgi:DNA adenine methylase